MSCFITGVKGVPVQLLWDYLNPAGLAIMIQCDGYWHGGVILCQECYTLQQTIDLHHILLFKFHLECTLVARNKAKGSYRIRIRARSIPQLRKLVLPYMEESMLHKIDYSWEGSFGIDLRKAERRVGYSVQAVFQITMHSRDIPLLYQTCLFLVKSIVRKPEPRWVRRKGVLFMSIQHKGQVLLW